MMNASSTSNAISSSSVCAGSVEYPAQIWCLVCGKPEPASIHAKPFVNIFQNNVAGVQCNIADCLASALLAEVDEHNAPSPLICENCLNLTEKTEQLKQELLQVYLKMRNLYHETLSKVELKMLRPAPKSSPIRYKKSLRKFPLIPRSSHTQENFIPQLNQRGGRPRKVQFMLETPTLVSHTGDEELSCFEKEEHLAKKYVELKDLQNNESYFKPACLDIFQPDDDSPEKNHHFGYFGQEKKRRRENDVDKICQVHEAPFNIKNCRSALSEENYEEYFQAKKQKTNPAQKFSFRSETGSFHNISCNNDIEICSTVKEFENEKVPVEEFEESESILENSIKAQIFGNNENNSNFLPTNKKFDVTNNKHSKAAQTDDTSNFLEKMCVKMKETFAISDNQSDLKIESKKECEVKNETSHNLLCDICGEDFTNQEQIKNHIEVHFTPNY